MSLIPVTKKSNPQFVGFATAEQIAKNPNLIIAGTNHDAVQKVEQAAASIAEKKAIDESIAAGKPSESKDAQIVAGAKPSDVKRKP